MKLQLTRVYRFEAAHRLHAPRLSKAQNEETYGKCNRIGGHGHNYEVEISLEGEPDGVTGLLISREEMDRIARERLLDRCDHRNLDDVVDDVSTGENLARIFFEWLEPAFGGRARLVRVSVFETPRNRFDAARN